MGYNLKIGEALGQSLEDGLMEVADVFLEEAPAFGEPTDHTNERWPSYSAWSSFIKDAGLDWFRPDKGAMSVSNTSAPKIAALMPSHPGVVRIYPEHLKAVEAARQEYHRKIGLDKKPGWPEDGMPAHEAALYDGHLARFVWLEFWLRWALENCRKPVFMNS